MPQYGAASVISAIPSDVCPVWMHRAVQDFHFFQSTGSLPNAGGTGQQDARYMAAHQILDSEMAWIEKSKREHQAWLAKNK